jgi:hypothetical protein
MATILTTIFCGIQKLFKGQLDAHETINNALDELDKRMPYQLARLEDIDAGVTGQVPLVSVPAGRVLIVTQTVLRGIDVSSIAGNPSISAGGNSPDFDDFAADATRDLDTARNLIYLNPPASPLSYAAGTDFSLNINSAALGMIMAADVFGYFVDA